MSILRTDVNKILIRIQKGEEESKNVLFEKTYNHLKRIAYPYVRNKADVEDVLVDAYLKMYQYVSSFDPKKDGYNWMCKIVQNVAWDWNKQYSQEIPLEDITPNSQVIEMEDMIADKDEVARLLQAYSERDRKMMYLRFWEDRTIEEIAEALGMGKSNVHKQISKITKEILKKEKNRVEKQGKKQVNKVD